jgi:hypothetical protein
VLLQLAHEIRAATGPLEAEIIASGVASLGWDSGVRHADLSESLGQALIERAADRRAPAVLALLTALAAVTQGDLATEAASAAQTLREQGVARPVWNELVGEPRAMGCFRARDAAGDGYAVISLFAYEGEPKHAVIAFVDRNLGGLARDAFVSPAGDEMVERYRQESSGDEAMRLDDLDPAEARALVERAFRVTEHAVPFEPPLTGGLRRNRALVLSRMRLLPAHPRPYEVSFPEDVALRGEGLEKERQHFLQRPEVVALGPEMLVRRCVDEVLYYSEFYDDKRLLRVSATKMEVLLVDELPNWSDLTEVQLGLMARILELWCQHVAARTGLPKSDLIEAVAAIDKFGPGLVQAARVADSSPTHQLVREHAFGLDIWDRADAADRLTFALLIEPGKLMLDDAWMSLDDDLQELAELAHPEYADLLLAEDKEELAADGIDPHLHVALHAMVAEQLWNDRIPEVWGTARRLRYQGYDKNAIHHMLMGALHEALRPTILERSPVNLDLYRDRLAALSESGEEQRPS